MRKLLAIALLLIVGLPVISPLFALSGSNQSRLPICCRRNGAHKCQGMDAAPANAGTQGDTKFKAPVERCPYRPSALVASHTERSASPQQQSFSWPAKSGFVAEAEPRTAAGSAISTTHYKRGPPTLAVL